LEEEKREILAKQPNVEKEQEQLDKFKKWCADMREKLTIPRILLPMKKW